MLDVVGRPVRVMVGDEPLARMCSGEFGRFDNVTSREAQARDSRD